MAHLTPTQLQNLKMTGRPMCHQKCHFSVVNAAYMQPNHGHGFLRNRFPTLFVIRTKRNFEYGHFLLHSESGQ